MIIGTCGSASAIGRIGAVLGPLIVPVVLAAGGNDAVVTLGAAAFVLAAAVVIVLGTETKQKVLKEVSA